MLVILILALLHLTGAWWVTTRCWRPGRLAEVPAAVVLTAMASFYGLPIAIGWTTGHINLGTCAGSAVVAFALGGFVWWRNRGANPGARVRDFGRLAREIGWAERAGWLLVAAVLLVTMLVGSRLPIRIWDAAGYHIHAPIRWAGSHRFILDSFGPPGWDGYSGCAEFFPNVKAVLPYLVLDITGRQDGMALAQWPFLVLLAVSTVGLLAQTPIARRDWPVVVLFTLTAPEVLIQSTEAYADVAFVGAQIATAWCVLRVWNEGASRRGVALAALAFALLAGAKPTGLLMAGVLGAALLVAVAVRCAPGTPLARRLALAGAAMGLVLVVCLFVAGPWYIHALRAFGNPIYPAELHLGSWVLAPGAMRSDINQVWVELHTGRTGLAAWWATMSEANRVSTIAMWDGGLGAAALLLGLPSTLLLAAAVALGEDRRRWSPVLTLFALMLLGTVTRAVARQILFELASFAIAFAWVLMQSGRLARWVLVSVFVLCAAYNVARWVPAVLYRPRPPEVVAYALLSGHTDWLAWDGFPEEYGLADLWRDSLASPGMRLGVPTDTGSPGAFHTRHGDMERVPLVAHTGDPARWIDDVRGSGVTHLFVLRNSPEGRVAFDSPEQFKLLHRRVDSGREHTWFVTPAPDEAVFEVSPKASGEARP